MAVSGNLSGLLSRQPVGPLRVSFCAGQWFKPNLAYIYLSKVNNRNTKKKCKICSKLTIRTPERRHWRRSDVFIINFEHILRIFLVFLLLTLDKQMLAGKRIIGELPWFFNINLNVSLSSDHTYRWIIS